MLSGQVKIVFVKKVCINPSFYLVHLHSPLKKLQRRTSYILEVFFYPTFDLFFCATNRKYRDCKQISDWRFLLSTFIHFKWPWNVFISIKLQETGCKMVLNPLQPHLSCIRIWVSMTDNFCNFQNGQNAITNTSHSN